MAYIDWWNRTGPVTLGERFGLNEGGRVGFKDGTTLGAKKLVEPMSKEMKAWLKKEKNETDWVDLNRADRAKLKKRFANRNNPYFKGLEQKKIFENYIEGLIKKGETSAWDKSIEDLVKDSKAKIEKSAAQDIIADKNFAVKGTSMTKLYPKLEARAIELLNQGLSGPEVTTTLENEGVIKVRKTWDESKGRLTRDIRPFARVYENLLEEGKVKKITKTIPGLQVPIAERTKIDTAIFNYMKKNPDMDSAHQIAKAVSAEINRDITGDWVKNAITRSGQNPDKLFQTSNKKIFSDVKALDKIIKNNQKLLADPNVTFADKSRILTKRYAEATGKPFKIAAGEFITRMRKLGNLYSKQPQRFEKELYNTIKAPANYVGSSFQANFMALADASGQLSVVDKAKLLALPKNEIRLLSELSTAAGELGKFSMAGDHTDIDALMKNFSNYRKNFTRVEWIRNSINNYKRSYDQKIMSLYAAAKRGQTTVTIDGEPVAIKDRIKFLQNEFKNKTGYRLGGFKTDAKGKPYIEPTTPRLPDIKNPVNTVLRQTLQGLGTYRMPGQEAIKITNAFDKAMVKSKTVPQIVDTFKKWKGKSELLNSRYIKAAGSIPRLKNLVKLLTAGTITTGAMTTLAQADTGIEKAKSWPIEHPWLTGAGATGAAATTKGGRNILGKAFRTLGTPLAGLGWAGWTAYDNLKSGKSLTESVVDPLVGMELTFPSMFKENLSKITKSPTLQKVLGLGKFGSRFMPGVGTAITLGSLSRDSVIAINKEAKRIDAIEDPDQQAEEQEIFIRNIKGYAGGGLTRTVAPDSGPVSRGLRSLYIDDMD